MFATQRPSSRRLGILYVLTISLTVLLLAASSIPTSASPDASDAQSGINPQTTRLSNPDRTATARFKTNASRPRNVSRHPTSTAMADGASLIFGPDSGELVSEVDNDFEEYCADVSVQNFIVRLRMFNPRGTGLWDYAIAFRQDSERTGYRFVVISRGQWVLGVLDAAASQISNANVGSIANMDIRANGFNDIVLIVQDELAMIAVNGEYLTPPRINELVDVGEICLMIDSAWERDGRIFAFENFSIEELP
jgi:hypothetical protein